MTFGTSLKTYTDPSQSIRTIPLEHGRIHANRAWSTFREIDSLGSTNSSNLLIKVANENPHLRYVAVDTSGSARIRLFEGTAVSENGTSVPTFRNNRKEEDTPNGVTLFHTPTITGDGTTIDSWLLSGPKTGGTIAFDQEEYILKANTNYLVRITNIDNQSINAVIRMFWYLER